MYFVWAYKSTYVIDNIFIPKILRPKNEKCRYTMYPYGQFGIFYGHLVYFMAIWYILWPFGIFYGPLVYFGTLHLDRSGNPDPNS
jgi:hypothetical protein